LPFERIGASLLSRARSFFDADQELPGSVLRRYRSFLRADRPALVLRNALAISDNGAIVAQALSSFSAAFKEAKLGDIHRATWTWGDESKDAAVVSERNGTGNASG